ncbi:hypothetical protein ACIRFH_30160 [Streptomyces sp. NPDC093586]|uniref:hypothetical protein n=1 Tax=Streptomyces sp. NPDC093586 TaxID=3366042 RepID=UPI0037F15ACE
MSTLGGLALGALPRFFAENVPGFRGDPLAGLGPRPVHADPAFAPVLAGRAASTGPRPPVPADPAEGYAAAKGRGLGGLGRSIVLGCFRIAVIAEGVHARHRQDLSPGSRPETVGDEPAPLAAAGQHVLRRNP